MKNILIFIMMCAAAFATSFACEPQQGYRGFAEVDASFGRTDEDGIYYGGISTSHGYQINKSIFAGAGLEVAGGFPGTMVPVFAQFRYDRAFGKFTPFGDIRLGYNIAGNGGLYFSPTIGYRLNWRRKANINIGIGMTLLDHLSDKVKYEQVEGRFNVTTVPGKDHKPYLLFAFRLGFDF